MPIYTSTKRLYSPMGRPFLSEKIPITSGLYAWYDANSFSGTTWFDKSGNGRNASVTRGTVTKISTTGNGASKTFNALQGGTGDGIQFPTDVLPSTYTLFHVTRYQGSTSARIITGINNNWLSGHWNGYSGVAYHEGWITQSSRTTAGNNWVLSTDQNSLYRGNRTTHGTSGGSLSTRLSVNAGVNSEYSAWQCSEVIVYNRTLSFSEYVQVEEFLNDKYGLDLYYTGNIVTSGLALHLNVMNVDSYPNSGTTLYDLSGNSINASGSSSLSMQQISREQAYNTASTSILNTDTHSLFFAIHIDGSTGTWDKIFGYTPSGTDRSPGIWRWPSTRRIHWRYDPNNTGADFSTNAVGNDAGTEFSPFVWYYVGVVKNGSTATSYVNGYSVGSQTVSNPKTAGNSTIQIFPGYTGSTAGIRNLQVYTRALSSAEVLQNYNSFYPELKYSL